MLRTSGLGCRVCAAAAAGLAVSLLALAARAEEPLKPLTPEELHRKLEEADRSAQSIKRLETRMRIAERRVAELEDTLRQVRLKVEDLELHMKSVEELLAALRKEIAALRSRPEPPEPKGGTPSAAPGARGTPLAAGLATISSQKASYGADLIEISGNLKNTSDKPLVFVLVEATFLDSSGAVVKTDSTYTEPRVIPAGATGTFLLKTTRDPRIKDHRLALKTE